ncbi:hypothetical protein [Mucilaginibacter sp. MD40]|uniref:hypothetical protein n=1 Tax=Mucilaginibacter sp. MD40 TaxID=2029590 RepID=UPI0018E91FC8|nr:hypothetical protein [Mucilaginibacter sp. MD40]
MEEKKEDEKKLMSVYSSKYYAKRFGDTTMVIADEDGDALIAEYLTPPKDSKDGQDKSS